MLSNFPYILSDNFDYSDSTKCDNKKVKYYLLVLYDFDWLWLIEQQQQ